MPLFLLDDGVLLLLLLQTIGLRWSRGLLLLLPFARSLINIDWMGRASSEGGGPREAESRLGTSLIYCVRNSPLKKKAGRRASSSKPFRSPPWMSTGLPLSWPLASSTVSGNSNFFSDPRSRRIEAASADQLSPPSLSLSGA